VPSALAAVSAKTTVDIEKRILLIHSMGLMMRILAGTRFVPQSHNYAKIRLKAAPSRQNFLAGTSIK
jgi:hypothetical protein